MQRSQVKHHCPIPLPCALPQPRPTLLTQFPPDSFLPPFHTPCPVCSVVLPPPTHQLLLPWQARQHHLGRHISFSFPSFSAFSYSPSPASHLFPASLPLSFFQDVFQMLLLCIGSSHPPCPHTSSMLQPRSPAAQCISPSWMPLGPHRRALAPAWPVQPPGPSAVLKHSLQGQDLFEKYVANF